MAILKKLAHLLKKFPIKSIMISIIVVVILAIGVSNIYMATGNDTLVKTKTDVHQDNLNLEAEFGGESIIVLYEADNLLTPNHLEHMKGIESELQTNESIYSMISPVTLVEEIAEKQSDTFQDGISDIIEGLDEMGGQLIEISKEFDENAAGGTDVDFPSLGDFEIPEMENPTLPELSGTELPEFGEMELPEFEATELPEFTFPEFGEIEVPDMEGDMSNLDQAFLNMIEAQKKLGAGTENLLGSYAGFSEQLTEVGGSLFSIAENMEDSPEKVQLEETGQKLNGLSEQMSQIPEETGQLPAIPEETIKGLNNIQGKLEEQLQEQKQLLVEQEKLEEQMQTEMKEQQANLKKEMETEQATQQEEMKQEMDRQQNAKEDKIKEEMESQQKAQQAEIKQEMDRQQETQKSEMQAQMEEQQAEKETEMEEFKNEMDKKQEEQTDKLSSLGEGLAEMGENLQSISENMETIEDYSDIMSAGLPTKQATLDNMIYEDNKLRTMFEEVVVDDHHMMMLIKFDGKTNDEEKSDVVEIINNYLEIESLDSADIIVSGKPVLDNGIRSSMQESIQKMMGLALLIMVIILSLAFRVRWRLLPLVIVLVAVIGTVGLMGWLQIPITMVSMAVFPILIGLGIDYAIQFQNRYTEEMAKEDLNE